MPLLSTLRYIHQVGPTPLILIKDEEINDASKDHFVGNMNNRYGFRCDYHFADGSCYGGPDGGNCPSGRRRRSDPQKVMLFGIGIVIIPSKVKIKMKTKIQTGFSLANNGKCGRGWMEITSQKECQQASSIFGLKFELRRDNTSFITGCVASVVFEEKGNHTVEKAICKSAPIKLDATKKASHLSYGNQLKRIKRQAGHRL